MPGEEIHPNNQGAQQPTGPDGPDINALRDVASNAGFSPEGPSSQSGEQSHAELSQGSEQPADETAAEVGGVALSDEDKARLTALNDDPEHTRGNVNMAHEMSNATFPLEQVINNINSSDLPNKEELVKTLRERGEELADKAREKFIKDEELYKYARDDALGKVLSALSGEFEDERRGEAAILRYKVGGGNELKDEDGQNILSPALFERLRKEMYTYVGATPPNTAEFDNRDDIAKKIDSDTNIDGIKIVETRFFANLHNGNPKGETLEQLGVWLVRKKDKEEPENPPEHSEPTGLEGMSARLGGGQGSIV